MQNQRNIQDVRVNNLSISSALSDFDLSPFLVELNVEENLFKTSMTGSIVLSDSYNIPAKFPIVGEEFVNIDISLSGVDGRSDDTFYTVKTPNMYVNSLDARYFSTKEPKAQVFTLDLISEQYISNIHSKVSKSYHNTTISNIVTDIYNQYLYNLPDSNGVTGSSKQLLIEPTDKIESLIIPNLHPLEAIKWLTQRAIQKDNAGVNYVFYETIDNCNFISLNKLSEREAAFTYKYFPRTKDSEGVELGARGIYRINKLHFVRNFDRADNAINGLYASKLVTHDIVKKKITQYDFNNYQNFVSLNHVGSFPVISSSDMELKSAENPRISFAPHDKNNNFPIIDGKQISESTDSHVVFYPKHDKMYANNKDDLYDNKVEEWKLQRTAQIKSYDNITLMIEAAGNSFLRVGHTINVEVPSSESTDGDKNSDNYLDKFLSGVYMVTAIKHTFNRTIAKDNKITYTMKIEITKDALEDIVINKTREEV